jgi:hypothetical protein
MTERAVRLRKHEQNIERYQSLLKTELTDVEQQYVQKRLSEERFWVAMLEFMGPSPSSPIEMRNPSKAL